MCTSYEEFIARIHDFTTTIGRASMNQLTNEDWVTTQVGTVGLWFESRTHPDMPNLNMYGDDAVYMNKVERVGLWQVPRQLAQYLIRLKDCDIQHFLDIGTCSGATITVIAIYLLRFGLLSVQTIDVYRLLDTRLIEKWDELRLPIEYTLMSPSAKFTDVMKRSKYDVVFIDGNHEFAYVWDDYNRAKDISRWLTFHDINDVFCAGVVQAWVTIKDSGKYSDIFEFTYHSHGLRLMGIGLLQL